MVDVIPDDTAGRPLTPGEQAAIADLERRLLHEAPIPVRDRVVGVRSTRVGHPAQTSGPLVVLLAVGLLLVGALIVNGSGLLGVAAVLVSVAGTAALWPLLPAGLGGPLRPSWRSHRIRRAVRGNR